VSVVDVSSFADHGHGISTVELAGLMQRCGAETVVLMEADDHLATLAGQVGRGTHRLPGRRVGLFIRSTNYAYPHSGSPSLRVRLGWLRRLPTQRRVWPRLFHEWLLPRERLLDAALCLDESFVLRHSATHSWMPDIFMTAPDVDTEGKEETRHHVDCSDELLGALHEFLEAHVGREVLVYFGTARVRRGYDTLLRLAVERRGCFIHCGLADAREAFVDDVAALRQSLSSRGALFETGAYVAGFRVAEAFLAAGACVVLPYRHHLGSSGVMLQALRAGRPVLVPNEGLMAQRVRENGLGAVYRPGDWIDLNRQYAALCRRSPEEFAPAIARFLEFFSREQVEAAILAAVEGGGGGAPPPPPSPFSRTAGRRRLQWHSLGQTRP
jgi:glycosyltransferase involved in cell wall biosynthesis